MNIRRPANFRDSRCCWGVEEGGKEIFKAASGNIRCLYLPAQAAGIVRMDWRRYSGIYAVMFSVMFPVQVQLKGGSVHSGSYSGVKSA